MLGITLDWKIYSLYCLSPALGAPKGQISFLYFTKMLRN